MPVTPSGKGTDDPLPDLLDREPRPPADKRHSRSVATAGPNCDGELMSLWMSWTLDGVGTAGQAVADVAAAVRALDRSVAQSQRAFTSQDETWDMLRNAADHVRRRMLDEGRAALERGQSWSLALGGVHVQLTWQSRSPT